jgi:hypothetical protein
MWDRVQEKHAKNNEERPTMTWNGPRLTVTLPFLGVSKHFFRTRTRIARMGTRTRTRTRKARTGTVRTGMRKRKCPQINTLASDVLAYT